MKNNKTKNLYRLTVIPMLIIMAVIFFLSNENAEKSSVSSSGITKIVINIVRKDYEILPDKEKMAIFDNVSFYVRKAGHFLEFAALGFTANYHASSTKKERLKKNSFVLSLLFSVFYAFTDEFHQAFIGGRSPEVRDVLVDTTGALFGILCFCLLVSIVSMRKSKLSAKEYKTNVKKKDEKKCQTENLKP